MTPGRVTKIVTSFGATWGRVQPHGESRELFFNLESLARPADFKDMEEGQEVEFDEEADRANGARAVHLSAILLKRLSQEEKPSGERPLKSHDDSLSPWLSQLAQSARQLSRTGGRADVRPLHSLPEDHQ
jgi:cold shock CspA family protein